MLLPYGKRPDERITPHIDFVQLRMQWQNSRAFALAREPIDRHTEMSNLSLIA